MASTVAADDTDRPPSRPDPVPVIDLSLLSQSDLYSLSLSSNLHQNDDDVVIPKINRAVFNESAGSRKQTYSRLRLASAGSSTLHRRTPHLRLHTHAANTVTDPEQAENSTIIRMLKDLCKSDPDFKDVAVIDDENKDTNGSVVSELWNHETETLGVKRKRGRPRKHENVVFIRPPSGKRLRHNAIKKEVVYDDDKDRMIVNERGVVVDLVGVGGLEDPYGPEIRRRTIGMESEDDLLGFLRGLNGHWGSRRRKRRVVDASEFGDVLPKGWKLSLCIKKKEGRVWLYCRRYLSPSGRQFESCKDISTYLISLIGEENMDKQNVVNVNGSDDLAFKEASWNAADLVLQEDIKSNGPVANPSPSSLSPSPSPSPSLPSPSPPGLLPVSAKSEEQVSLDAMEVQVENNVKTDQPGIHVENEIDKIKPLPEKVDDSVSGDITLVETNDACLGDKINSCKESNADVLVHDLNVVSQSKEDEHFDVDKSNSVEESHYKLGQNGIMDDEAYRTEVREQPPDDTVSQSELFGDEFLMSTNEKSNREPETSGEIRVMFVEDKLDSNHDQVINQDTASETGWRTGCGGCDGGEDIVVTAPSFNDGGEDIMVTATSVGMVDQAFPDPVVEKASICEDKNSHLSMDVDINNTSNDMMNDMIPEKGNVVAETSSGIFLGRFGLDNDGATVVEGLDSAKAVSTETVVSLQKQESDGTYNNNTVDKLPSDLTSSRIDELFDVDTNAFGSYEDDELNKNLDNDVSFSTMEEPVMQISSNKSEEVKLDDFHIFRNNEPKRNESDNVMDFSTKSNLEFCSLVPSENEQAFGFQDCLYDNTMEECKEQSSERGLLNHFSDDIFENKMYSTSLDGLKFDEDRDLNSNELSLAFGNSNVPSKIEEAFDVHTNLSMVNNSSMVEELKSGSGSVGGLFNLSGNVKTSTFPNTWDGIKSGEFKFKSSGSKFTAGFRSNHGQTHEEAAPSNMWRTGDGNQLQSGLPIRSHAHIPSPSSFHSFNIMPGKAGDGQFRLDERYNEGYGVSGLRSGRPEPVEFSFLTAGRSQHNPHQLQGDSRVFSYNPEMDQQFDSTYWLGKNTMMPNPAGRNQMTAVCALCRNEFHLHPAHFGTQNGIGPLCPSCSAGMSGHVNML